MDFVKPFKLETPELGTENDEWQHELDPSEDAVIAAGFAIETSGTLIYKDDLDNIVFSDEASGTYTLAELAAGGGLFNIDCGRADSIYSAGLLIDGGGA